MGLPAQASLQGSVCMDGPPQPPRTQAPSPDACQGSRFLSRSPAHSRYWNIQCDGMSLCREVRQCACQGGRACKGAHRWCGTKGATVSGWASPGPGEASLDPSLRVRPPLLSRVIRLCTAQGNLGQGLRVRACGCCVLSRVLKDTHTPARGVHTATHVGHTMPQACPESPQRHPRSPLNLPSSGLGCLSGECALPWVVVCHPRTGPEDRGQGA